MEGRVWGALAATTLAGSGGLAGTAGLAGEFQIVQIICVFTAKVTRVTLRCNVFFYFFIPPHLKHLVLRAFLEDCLPEMFSKLGVLAETSMKKSTKTSRDSSGGPGRLWRSGSALGGSGGALGGRGRALGGST